MLKETLKMERCSESERNYDEIVDVIQNDIGAILTESLADNDTLEEKYSEPDTEHITQNDGPAWDDSAIEMGEMKITDTDQSIVSMSNLQHVNTELKRTPSAGSRRTGIVDPPDIESLMDRSVIDLDGDANSTVAADVPNAPRIKDSRRGSDGCFCTPTKQRKLDPECSYGASSQHDCLGPIRSSVAKSSVQNAEVCTCRRMHMRRNALCDPFRLPMPQRMRERLERDNEKRKSSVTRKVSKFLTVSLDLNREEDLI